MAAFSLMPLLASITHPPHILSDTPSFHRLHLDWHDFFGRDMDLLHGPAASNTTCSGRGFLAGEPAACSCDAGYTGTRCEYAGPSWSALQQPSQVPKSRAHHTLTVAGEDRVYLFGGATFLDGKTHRMNDLHYYTPTTKRWTTPYAMGHWPAHRSGHSTTLVQAGAHGARLLVLGGIDGDGVYTNSLDVYELDAQRWSRPRIESAPPPRARHTAVALGGSGLGSVWLFGGRARAPPSSAGNGRPVGRAPLQRLNDVHVLDVEATPPVWYTPRVSGAKPPPRAGHSATLLADELSVVVFGGDGGDDDAAQSESVFYNDVWIFSFQTGWREIEPRGVPPQPRALHTAHRSNDWLAILGGVMAPLGPLANTRGDARSPGGMSVHLLHLERYEWRELSPRGELPLPRFGHASVLISSSLLVVGGVATAGGLKGGSSNEGAVLDGLSALALPQHGCGDCAAHGGECALGQCLCSADRGGIDCELTCEAGWGGYLCMTPACSCGTHGSCTAPGVCSCDPGWHGATCEVPLCLDGCGSHGVCIAPGECLCAQGWAGLECEVPSCPDDCNGHGVCETAGVCACKDRWTGSTCAEPVCIADCSQHGTCVRPGECECSPGWHGESCADRICPLGGFRGAEVCSQHGRCEMSGCICETGWEGHACNVRQPPAESSLTCEMRQQRASR